MKQIKFSFLKIFFAITLIIMAVELVFAILTNNLGYYLSAFSVFVTSIALFLTIKIIDNEIEILNINNIGIVHFLFC
jgi:hypothetical protein